MTFHVIYVGTFLINENSTSKVTVFCPTELTKGRSLLVIFITIM